MPWPNQPTPYASACMAPPAWPMYMPSYMPWPPTLPAFMQAEFEELARQHQDLEACELKVQLTTRTCNLNAVRDAGQLHQFQAACALLRRNRHLGVLIPRLHLRYPIPPSVAPPSGIEVSSGHCSDWGALSCEFSGWQ